MFWGQSPTSQVQADSLAIPLNATTRHGGWLDQINITEMASGSDAVAQLQAGTTDIYASVGLSDPALLATVQADPNLTYKTSYGFYTDLTFNPSGPTFNDGRLNPFSNRKIREAMNRLVNRDQIVDDFFGGLAVPKYAPVSSTISDDYARYVDTVRSLEIKYSYNVSAAKSVIDAEMLAMGAVVGGDGKWQYNGSPVVVIMLIRTEDERTQIGDYVAGKLGSIGFTVSRQYKPSSETTPIWLQSDPAEGQWHIYTGAWVTNVVSRDDAENFGFFYAPLGYYGTNALWQAYTPTAEFLDVATRLYNDDFT